MTDTQTPAGSLAADIDGAIATATKNLASSAAGLGASLAKLPTILVLGRSGSGKTTVVAHSGLEPSLLSGTVFQGDAIAPTRGLNLWFAKGNVLVEAGGGISSDAALWARVLGAAGPSKNAPRRIVVCVSCEEFFKADAAKATGKVAQELGARLSEAARAFGARLPVYVIFTKMDRIPYFEDYARTLSSDEARAVRGATFPGESPGSPGAAQITESMEQLFRSFAAQRATLLARETANDAALRAYEFPREFRKLAPLIASFLDTLCGGGAAQGASQSGDAEATPFLRGFYFTALQSVVVVEEYVAPTASVAEAPSADLIAAPGATAILDRSLVQKAARTTGVRGPITRTVPRWDFLQRIFPDVILADRSAIVARSSTTSAGGGRRAIFAAVAVVALIVMAGLTMSFAGNRKLLASAQQSARDVAALSADVGQAPSADALRRLDALRAQVDTFARYARNGAPLRLGFGLSQSPAAYTELRRTYFAAFQRLMFSSARAALATALEGLPDTPAPTSDIGATYNQLKAYLMATDHPEKSADTVSARTLADVLMRSWPASHDLDATSADVARRQFAFYANELQFGNPYPDSKSEAPVVQHAQEFLRPTGGLQLIYQNMRREAARATPVQFNRDVAGSAAVIKNTYDVGGEFTKEGWAAMMQALSSIDRYLQGETWVVGTQSAPPPDRSKAAPQIRALYVADYIAQWKAYLDAALLVRSTDLADAAQKLKSLSEISAPMLRMFWIASRNTAVDTAVKRAFETIQQLTPPGDSAKLIGGKNEAYMRSLIPLANALPVAVGAPRGDPRVLDAIRDAAAAQTTVDQLAQDFSLDPVVRRLLEAPIRQAEQLLRAATPGR